jgi:hypothetical protein
MFPFCGFGPFDRSERKALLFAAGVSVLFIFVFSFARPHARTVKTLTTGHMVPPPAVPDNTYQRELVAVDLLQPFRVQPIQFERIDFENRSYGAYTSAEGKKIELRLMDGEFRLPNDSGQFSLMDVYYRDLTGDGLQEAIVWLSHLHCNEGSCNRRTDLFYVYSLRDRTLKPIWEYETGSYAEGCGLRAITFWQKQINLMLFGECPGPAMDHPAPANYISRGFTHILLEFDGRHFTQAATEFYITPPTDLHDYKPAININ